jgi:alkylhydroperoxidase family enzyme
MAYGSKGAGVSPEKEAALWEYETSDLFTAAERAALHVARGAGQVPNAVTDEDFDELKKHYSDEQIVEILAAISTFGFFNRYNDTLATELESSPLQAAKEILEPRGWDVGKHG